MVDKPTTADGYSPGFLEQARRTLLHLATILGDWHDDIVLVGGLVPSLLCDGPATEAEQHVGTMDVDLGLSLTLMDDKRYQELSERMRRAGFVPDQGEGGQVIRQRWVWEQGSGVSVDFLIPPNETASRGGSIQHLEGDFAAVIAPGLPLAFQDRRRVRLEGETLSGERAVRDVWVCGPGAYVVLKALAFRGRGENKDAYDLFYVLKNTGGGIEGSAEALQPLRGEASVQEALKILREDFTEPDQLGPMRVAAFLRSEGNAGLLADVAGFVRRLLALLGGE